MTAVAWCRLRIYNSLKPVIAAINGPAVGVGITMTLPMDFRLASESARIGFVFARRGIVPEACSSWFLPRLVGIQQATEWVFTGRVFPAVEALGGGLVRSVHPADELLPAARALAMEIAENTAPVSVALSRQMLWRMLGAGHPMVAHRVDSRGIAARGPSADAREGVVSFLEKRPPVFPAEGERRVAADLPRVGGARVLVDGRPAAQCLRSSVTPSRIGEQHAVHAGVGGDGVVEGHDGQRVRVGGAVVEHAPAPDRVVHHDQPAGPEPDQDLLEVPVVVGLVGVDEAHVEVLAFGEGTQRLQGGPEAEVDLALHTRFDPVAAADRRPLLVDVAAEQLAVVG